ncbi:MAG TPA: DUF4919 domain-containing protein [Myxococcota bacterium]|nr:DUF4919 domain-containing protein [Myxococcota bacterium]
MRSGRLLATALLWAAFGCASQAPPAPAPTAASQAPAPKQASGDADPVFLDDFTRLRTQYGEREDFRAVCEADRPLRAMIEAANAARWQESLDVALPWLAHCPVDLDARVVAAMSLSQLGREQEADEHKRWFNGLVDSILDSGDGKTKETAFVVISVPEEYSLLRVFGLAVTRQMLLDNRIDALVVEDESGKSSTVYFDPAAHFRRLSRELGGK